LKNEDEAYTLRTLKRYLNALGEEFTLEVAVKYPENASAAVSGEDKYSHPVYK
jgi:hypothetical protein